MNARVSPDPHMHIFCVACANYDTLIQRKTFVFTKLSLFVQIASHSFNFEFCTRKLKGMDKTFLQHVSSSLISVLARVNHIETIIIPYNPD